MAAIDTLADRVIDHLEKLVPQPDGEGGDRGALARLRRGLRAEDPTREPDLFAVIGRFAYDDLSRSAERALFETAALFGKYPRRVGDFDGDLGTSMRLLARHKEKEGGADAAKPLERRFLALLNASQDTLFDHVRHAVGLLQREDVPVSYRRLMHDLHYFDHPDGFVRRDWSHHYWAPDVPRAG